MQPLRLLVVATAMVAVLALVAGLAATSDRVDQQRTATETSVSRPATAPPNDDLTVDVPAKKPIVVRVGDTVTLNVTIPQEDTLTVDAFGLREDIAGDVKTPVIVEAIAQGRYPLRLENSGTSIGTLEVKPALPATEQPATPEKKTTPDAPSTAALAPAGSNAG